MRTDSSCLDFKGRAFVPSSRKGFCDINSHSMGYVREGMVTSVVFRSVILAGDTLSLVRTCRRRSTKPIEVNATYPPPGCLFVCSTPTPTTGKQALTREVRALVKKLHDRAPMPSSRTFKLCRESFQQARGAHKGSHEKKIPTDHAQEKTLGDFSLVFPSKNSPPA